MYTAKELEELTKISRKTWFKWAAEGRVRSKRMGRCLRFRERDILKLLEE